MGHMFLLLIDAHSKWIEVHPMTSTTAPATVRCVRNVFGTFGVPVVFVTNIGPSFRSHEFTQFLKWNRIQHKTFAPYHLSTNGLAGRAVQTFKRRMKKLKQGNMLDKLARFLLPTETPHNLPQVSPQLSSY